MDNSFRKNRDRAGIDIFKKNPVVRFAACVLAMVMLLTLVVAPDVRAQSGSTVSNPQIVSDESYESGMKVTYDYVYFGSYPQAEVATRTDVNTVDKDIRNGNDYVVVSEEQYSKLEEAEIDENGDITVDGSRYRVCTSTDATHATCGLRDYYDWGGISYYERNGNRVSIPDTTRRHYFMYQPIKWRVLSVDSSNVALLLAEDALDCRKYNESSADVSWETSTVRSFLNSYGEASNNDGIDYSQSGFLNLAFTEADQKGILSASLTNGSNKLWHTSGGNATSDKVFLLSEEEMYGSTAKAFGFSNPDGTASPDETMDEARRAKSSTYAKAMGCWSYEGGIDELAGYEGCCWWWLRSPGIGAGYAASVYSSGRVTGTGNYVNLDINAVRPAIRIDLKTAGYISAGNASTQHTHTYRWTVVKAATCSTFGQGQFLCSCGAVQSTRTILKNKNKHEKRNTTIEKATPKADGKKIITCSGCGAVIKTVKIAMIKSVTLSQTEYTYDGKAKKPTVTVKDSDGSVIKHSHYTVTYSNNKVPGTATVKVKFKGKRYSGKITATFTIKPSKPAIKKVTNTSGGVKLTWKETPEVTGYIVYRSTDGVNYKKVKKISNAKKLSYTDKSAKKNGKNYYYKIKAYRVRNGSTVKSEDSKVKMTYFMTAPKRVKAVRSTSKKAKITYARNAKASSYQIQYSEKSSMKGAKRVTVKGSRKVSKVIGRLTAGKMYYVRVRSCKKVSGKTYYSAWSAKKKVSAKKAGN